MQRCRCEEGIKIPSSLHSQIGPGTSLFPSPSFSTSGRRHGQAVVVVRVPAILPYPFVHSTSGLQHPIHRNIHQSQPPPPRLQPSPYCCCSFLTAAIPPPSTGWCSPSNLARYFFLLQRPLAAPPLLFFTHTFLHALRLL